MLKEKRICFIGGGAMAEAMINGLLSQAIIQPAQLTVVELDQRRLGFLSESYGIAVFSPDDGEEALAAAEIVVLAVKPQQLACAMAAYAGSLRAEQLLISVLAGVNLATIRQLIPKGTRVVRAMPNTSAAVGLSATGICTEPGGQASSLDLAEAIFQSIGTVVRVSEERMDAITALSGSGPAYVFALAEAMEQGGVAAGLDVAVARELTKQTLLGAAQLLASGSQPPEELRRRVTSPGGTTMAALQVMQRADFSEMMRQAILSAAARSHDLAMLAAGTAN